MNCMDPLPNLRLAKKCRRLTCSARYATKALVGAPEVLASPPGDGLLLAPVVPCFMAPVPASRAPIQVRQLKAEGWGPSQIVASSASAAHPFIGL